MNKKLYRSNRNSQIAGVCGGLGEYFGIDPTIIRLVVVITFFTCGVGILPYIVASLVIPREPVAMREDKFNQYGYEVFRDNDW